MDAEYLTTSELSQYLNIKQSNLYAKVASGDLPHYRVGRLIRFKKEEIDKWMEGHRRKSIDLTVRSKDILKSLNGPDPHLETLVKKAIDEALGKGYNPDHGRPDQIKGLGKEVENGSI